MNTESYYMRNREHILERSTKAYREEQARIVQYQQNFLVATCCAKAKWREEHRDETREKSRETYAEKVMEEKGRIVVPTLKRPEWHINRKANCTDVMFRRAKIARRLEINDQRAAIFRQALGNIST
jgi:hypothetical protein